MSTTIGSARLLHDIRVPLNNGHGEIPALGFGTLLADPAETTTATKTAMEVGFRHLDTAERYRNEKEVGEAMQEVLQKGIVTREEMFVTAKLWNTNHRPDRVPRAFEASRKKLGLDYVDLYLIHTPFAFKPGDDQDPRDASGNPIYDEGVTLHDTWNAMERLVENGSCKAIGVSDFTIERLEEIVRSARIMPAVLQVEAHPYHPQWELLEFCKQHGIVMLAFAPLGHGIEPRLLDDPVITGIARTVGQAPSQVLLAWAIQRGTAVITSATNPRHMKESFAVAALPEESVKQISEAVTTRVRFNAVVDSGVPGFIPRAR
jgi:diketogulonate reductase-like aldo/keto reductase